ncbi:MAG: Ppx/GppA phosphatase family protein [Pseudomonadota bacterium]
MDKASGSGAISPEGYSRGAATVGRSQGGVQGGVQGGPQGGARGGPRGDAVARPSLPSAADGLLAALDLGTNNCRLLIAKAAADCAEADGPLSDPGFTVIDAFSRPVRLGEDIERTGSLSRSAQDRAIKALRICASKLRQRRVAASRIVATEACRRAVNGRAFVRRVLQETGLSMRVISAEEEARLAVAGCAPLVDPQAEQLLVVDIGGGSTELIWVDLSHAPASRRRALVRALAPLQPGRDCEHARAAAAHVCDWVSVPLGVSTLRDRFAGWTDDAARFEAMGAAFREALSGFRPLLPCAAGKLGGPLQIIGVSGTATTYGALHLGLRVYDRGQVDGLWLPRDAAEAITARLLTLGRDGRAGCAGIGHGRADLVLAGAAIMMAVMRLWPSGAFRIADRGLREGMLYGLLHQRRLAHRED